MKARTVYVAHDGATLRREGQRLRVMARRRPVAEVAVHDLGQLVLMGNVVLTPAAMDLLVDRGVDTVLLSHRGRYQGRLVGALSGNVRLRLSQYRMLTDEAAVPDLARRFVAAKIANQRVQLMRSARRHGQSEDLARGRIALRASSLRLSTCDTLDEVRGCEGAASAAYFRVFDAMLRAPGFRFDGRNRRPPMDPVNALLSLGYTLLSNVVEAAIHVVGLDPYLGALHAPVANRPSLVCDVVEELRAPVVDALVVAALNKSAFRPEDFEDAGQGEPVVLRRETLRWFVTLFERRMERGAHYAPFGKRLSWRDIAEQQARRLARHFLEDEAYEGYSMR